MSKSPDLGRLSDLLARLVAIDTQNPPGREIEAATVLTRELATAGFAAETRELGRSLDLLVNGHQLGDVHRLALAFPDLSIVVNHAGSPIDRDEAGMRLWQRGIARLASASNVAMKISDLCAYDHAWSVESYRPIVTALIESFGADRCIFASDFPVAKLHGSFRRHFDAFRMITSDLPLSCLSRMFCENAMRFYRL